jgi:hypothetical protein
MTILLTVGFGTVLPITWLALTYDNQIKNPINKGYFDHWLGDTAASVSIFWVWIMICQKVGPESFEAAYQTWYGYYHFQPIPLMAVEGYQGHFHFVPVVSIRLLKWKVFVSTIRTLTTFIMIPVLFFIQYSCYERDFMNLGLLFLLPVCLHLFVLAFSLDKAIQLNNIAV